jgi:hypothetical protein
MTTIPLSDLVQMLPGVISAGGAVGQLTGLVLTQNPAVPYGTVQDFFTAPSAQSFFGSGSPEAIIANNYFPGIVNGGQLPYDLKYVYYATAAGPAEVFGASLGALTLSQLQALPAGDLIVTTAATHTSSSINLATATSFANAATIMQAAFTSPDFTIAYDALRNRFTVSTNTDGPSVSISAVTGTLIGVGLTAAEGALLVATGFAADTAATVMNRVIALTTAFCPWTTAWTTVIADRLAFAQWNSAQNYQFTYVGFDTDAASIVPSNATSFGAQVFAAPYQGTWPVYGSYDTAGAAMAYAASINFNVPNGRTNPSFRQFNAGTAPTATSLATAKALRSNFYTYIGAYANAANTWTIMYNGQMSGQFKWVDTYLNQVWLNANLQQSTFEALLAYNSVPYNEDGYTDLYLAGLDPIDTAVEAGVIQPGVNLSQSEMQEIDTAAGIAGVGQIVATRGWYYLVADPGSTVRTARGSPIMKLWYADGGSVQSIDINSTAVL